MAPAPQSPAMKASLTTNSTAAIALSKPTMLGLLHWRSIQKTALRQVPRHVICYGSMSEAAALT
jgi:hypothetical protein